MCILAFSWNAHPRYRLIFAGNRDEFHARPSAAADWWQDHPDVFGGRDLEAGGSWLGLRRDGRFAVVTNFREPDRRPAGKRSRGELVAQFLSGKAPAETYLAQLRANADSYAGFNLLFGDIIAGTKTLYYFSNRGDQDAPVTPGVHALSNHLLDTPWPKVERLRERFAIEALRPEPATEALLDFLDDSTPAPMQSLPDTGLSPELERRLSAAKVVSPEYGTRASTVVLVGHDGSCQFQERRFDTNGKVSGETVRRFDAS